MGRAREMSRQRGDRAWAVGRGVGTKCGAMNERIGVQRERWRGSEETELGSSAEEQGVREGQREGAEAGR